MPARSWTTPSCRSAAILRRSSSDASSARSRSFSRSSWLRRRLRASRQASGTCTSQSRKRLTRRSAGEREPDPAPGGRDGRASLVRLEDQRRAVGRADGEVHLVDVTQSALVTVLRPFEAAQLRTRIARAKYVELLVAERERRRSASARPNTRCARRRSRLDPRDAVTEDALLHDPVEPRQAPARRRTRRRPAGPARRSLAR